MANLTYEQFKTEITENIKDYLPDDYKDAEVKLSTVNKIGKTYDSLFVRPKNKIYSPAADINMFFDAYESGETLDEIMRNIADVLQTEAPDDVKDISWLLDYEKVKERLFIRVSNADKNKNIIESAPHKKVEDLIITCHIAVNQGPNNMASTIVNKDLLERYGVTEDQLFEDAMKNAPEVSPVRIDSMYDFISHMVPEFEENPDEAKSMYIVTNKTNTYGAAAIFYSGILDKMYEKIGGSFIVLPSSVNEVIVVPDNGRYKDLKKMVEDINESSVEPEERLSNSVYKYDAESKSLCIVA